jgi:hypothetical protein
MVGTFALSPEIPIVLSPSEDKLTKSFDEFLQYLLEIFLGYALKMCYDSSLLCSYRVIHT